MLGKVAGCSLIFKKSGWGKERKQDLEIFIHFQLSPLEWLLMRNEFGPNSGHFVEAS